MRRLAFVAVLFGLSACGSKATSGVDCTQNPNDPQCTVVSSTSTTTGGATSSTSTTTSSSTSSTSTSSTSTSTSGTSTSSTSGSSGSTTGATSSSTGSGSGSGSTGSTSGSTGGSGGSTGASCPTDGMDCDAGSVCFQGQCQYGCYLDGGLQAPGASNGCAECDPLTSTTSWTPWDEGQSLPCPAGGEVCHVGACTPGCYVNNAFVVPDAGNPGNACETCQPATDTTAYSALPDTSVCNPDNQHFCRSDTCVFGCVISDAGVVDASTPEPGNDCYACQPAVGTDQYTQRANGQACTSNSGSVCYNGSCQLGCYISGTFYSDGSLKPGNPCQGCYASQNITNWSNPPEGTTCNNNTPGYYCHAGSCQNGCLISGAFYANGTVDSADPCQSCDVTRSTTAWSPKVCAANMACSNGQCVCNQGYAECDNNTADGCESLDTATNCGRCGSSCPACSDFTCGPKGITCCPQACGPDGSGGFICQ